MEAITWHGACPKSNSKNHELHSHSTHHFLLGLAADDGKVLGLLALTDDSAWALQDGQLYLIRDGQLTAMALD